MGACGRVGDDLAGVSARLTDGVIAEDLERIDRQEAEVRSLNGLGDAAAEYAVAKARAWMTVARTEYTDNDRSGFATHAFAQARSLAEAVRDARLEGVLATGQAPGSDLVRPDLWRVATEPKEHAWFSCTASLVGLLEVRLAWAGNEARTFGASDGGWHEVADEALAREAEAAAERCVPEPAPEPEPIPEPEPAPEPIPEPEPAPEPEPLPEAATLDLANRVHFAEGAFELTGETTEVLDGLAAVLQVYPEVTLVLRGQVVFSGDATENEGLARRRVSSVIGHLVGRGISRERLVVGSLIPGGNPLRSAPAGRRLGAAAWPELDRARERRVDITYRAPEHLPIRGRAQEDDIRRGG